MGEDRPVQASSQFGGLGLVQPNEQDRFHGGVPVTSDLKGVVAIVFRTQNPLGCHPCGFESHLRYSASKRHQWPLLVGHPRPGSRSPGRDGDRRDRRDPFAEAATASRPPSPRRRGKVGRRRAFGSRADPRVPAPGCRGRGEPHDDDPASWRSIGSLPEVHASRPRRSSNGPSSRAAARRSTRSCLAARGFGRPRYAECDRIRGELRRSASRSSRIGP